MSLDTAGSIPDRLPELYEPNPRGLWPSSCINKLFLQPQYNIPSIIYGLLDHLDFIPIVDSYSQFDYPGLADLGINQNAVNFGMEVASMVSIEQRC